MFGECAHGGHGEVVSEREVGLGVEFGLLSSGEDFEDEFVAFVSVDACECLDAFQGGGFHGEEAVSFEAVGEDAGGLAAAMEFAREEVAGS